MRKTSLALLTALALTFVSACGASGGDDASKDTSTTAAAADKTTTTKAPETTTTAGSENLDVKEWADGFCGSFGNWLDDIKAASANVSTSITPGDLSGAKTAIVNLFDTASKETESLISDIQDGGTPDINRGDQLVDDLIGKFKDFDEAITAAKTEAESLPIDNPTEFQAKVTTLVSTFQTETQTVGDSFGELDAKYNSQELNDALNASCSL